MDRLPKNAKYAQTKDTRLQKWRDMIQYGLETDAVRQIYPQGNLKNKNSYELGQNALVGL